MLSDGPQGGKVFAGRYRRLGRLGTGGMATVFLAKDELLGREVAIKRLHSAAPEDLQKRFRREARLGAALNHPNIVAIFDSVTDEDSLYIVMEYVKGEPLDARIDRGQVPADQALAILEQSAAAIDYAHSEDIVHRDIKPSNLLVRDDGVVKVADLGIATATDLSQITASGSVMGTLPYIAPERLRGAPDGPPADIYSLGAVAFEMLSGRRPIEAKTPDEAIRLATEETVPDLREVWPAAPDGAAEIICQALSPDPSSRPTSAGSMIDELERSLGETGSTNEDLAAATIPMAVIPDIGSDEPDAGEPDGGGPDSDEPPTAEQEIADDPLPPPPPRPEPARARRPPPPEAPMQAPAKPPRSLSGAAILAIVACIAVVAAIALAVFGGGDDDGETGGEPAAQTQNQNSNQGNGNAGEEEAEPAPAPAEPEDEPAPPSEEEPEEPATEASSEEEVPGVGTAPVIDPAQGAAINDEGYGILQSGDPAEALPYFQEAITYFPSGSTDTNYSFALYNLGDALTQLGRGGEAIPYLQLRLERWDDRDELVQATLAEAEAQAAE